MKERISHILKQMRRFFGGRPFAAVVLAAATLVMSTFVSVRSRAITVNDGDVSQVVLTMDDDPYKAVKKAGISLEEYDLLDVDEVKGTIDVNRAMTVEVQADGASTLLHMTEGTVADALSRANITVGQNDKISLPADTALSDGLLIDVDRVGYEEYTVSEAIPYETETRSTFVLSPGRTKELRVGVNGAHTVTYRKTVVNGEVVSTDMVKETVSVKPVTRILLVGSQPGVPYSKVPFSLSLNEKNQPVSYKTVYAAKSCTAYAIGTRGASGMRLGIGTVAVNPNIIPYGTKLWIASPDGRYVYGYAIAADTGTFASGTRTFCDLYFGSYIESCYFGRRNMNIYVL